MKKVSYLLVAVLAAAAGALAIAAPAAAVVLVNQPQASVCVGKSFKVGVWYQKDSGGPRAYRVAVYAPDWRPVLREHGRAPAANWRFWRVRAAASGRYHIAYRVRQHGAWLPYRVITQASRC